MTAIQELSAGVIPYRVGGDRTLTYLVLHSATVRNPRAKWEFPKGGIESEESPRQAAAREFLEETNLSSWAFREGFEQSLSYTYIRRGRKVLKTVTYFIVVRSMREISLFPSLFLATLATRSIPSSRCKYRSFHPFAPVTNTPSAFH